MPKPVLVVNYCVSGIDIQHAIHNLKSLKDVIEGSGANDDYYTFILPVLGDSHVQVFYDKDIDNNSFNNIRDLVDQRLKAFEEGINGDGSIGEKKPLFTESNKKPRRAWVERFKRRR